MIPNARGEADHDDLALVENSLRSLRDYSNLAAAEVLGVSEATVRRWRTGSIAVPLRTATRLSLRGFVESRSDAGAASQLPHTQPGSIQPFQSVIAIQKYLGDLAPPGAGADRKLEVLEGVRIVITACAPVPDWWFHLRDEVREGRL